MSGLISSLVFGPGPVVLREDANTEPSGVIGLNGERGSERTVSWSESGFKLEIGSGSEHRRAHMPPIGEACEARQQRPFASGKKGYEDVSPVQALCKPCGGPVQPSPAQPSPAQPGPAQPSPAQPCPAQPRGWDRVSLGLV